MSTGSPASSISSSDSYIVIRSLRVLCLRVLSIAFLPFGIDTVIVGEGSLSFSCFCSGFGFLDAPLPRVPSLVLLFAELCVGSVGCVSKIALTGVVWS